MNKYQKVLVVAVVVAIFLVSFMASPSAAVLASGLTAIFTPTVNRTPPPTSTEGGNGVMFGTVVPGSVVCPSGGVSNPLGVTPDPLWEAMCGQCMPTATGYPTFEFPTQRPTMDFSVTQPPACQTVAPYGENCPTSVPVSTVTPVFTNTPATPVSTVVPVDDGYLVLDDAGFFSLEGQPAPLSQSYSCTGDGTKAIRCEFSATTNRDITLHGFIDPHYVGSASSYSIYDYVYRMTDPEPDLGFPNDFGSNTLVDYLYRSVGMKLRVDHVSGSFDLVIVVSIVPLYDMGFTATPEITLTPDFSNIFYCASVNNGVSDLANQTITFWSPSGPPACLIVPSYDTSKLMLFLDLEKSVFTLLPLADEFFDVLKAILFHFQVISPAVTICLQPYEFLSIPLLGVVLVVQTFVDVILGVFIISHLMSNLSLE